MDKKNIIFNMTLEEYNQKYKYKKLKKLRKIEVDNTPELLGKKTWWYIDDVYYEIPKAPSYHWFRNLNKTVQIVTCCLIGAAVTTAIVVPTVIAVNKKNGKEVVIDESVKHVTCESKIVDGNLVITLKVEDGYEVTGISKIVIDKYELKSNEYEFKDGTITIKKEIIDKHSGKVIVAPVVSTIGTLKVEALPTKWIYAVGETFNKSGLKVNIVTESTRIDVTDKCSLSIADGYKFVAGDKADEKPVTVSYNGKETSFNIAVNDDCSEYLELYNGTNQVKAKSGVTLPKHLSIPEKLDGQQIDSVLSGGFQNNLDIETVDFRFSKITRIYNDAFNGCTNLKKVIINSDLNTIGYNASSGNAFTGCTSLEEINFFNTNKIQFFTNDNYNDCNNLKTISIVSEQMANLKGDEGSEGGFDSSLYASFQVVYVKSNIQLSTDSFIYNGFKKSNSSDRDGYDKWERVQYAYDVISEEDKTCAIKAGVAFNLKNAILPSTIDGYTVTTIGENAFKYCTTLSSVTIPKGVTSIQDAAFLWCESLTSIAISSTVTSVNPDAFLYCLSLTSITVDQANTKYDSRENCNAIIETSTDTLVRGCKNTVIPSDVKKIGPYAFFTCEFSTITITDGVEVIEDGAFGSSKLTSITIPSSVSAISPLAFYDCPFLTTINVDSGNDTYDSRNNCNAIIETSTNKIIAGCKDTTIPNTVTTIGDDAFWYCTLGSITLPDSITSIGKRAFGVCTSLSSINIPKNVTTIETDAFQNCYGLKSVIVDSAAIAAMDNPGALYNTLNPGDKKVVKVPKDTTVGTTLGNTAIYNKTTEGTYDVYTQK